MRSMGKVVLFSFIILNLAMVAIGQETAQNQPQGSEDRVGESRLSVTQPNGEILEFYRSAVSRWSFYYLPQARFVPLAFSNSKYDKYPVVQRINCSYERRASL